MPPQRHKEERPKHEFSIGNTPARRYRDRSVAVQVDGAWMHFTQKDEAEDFLRSQE